MGNKKFNIIALGNRDYYQVALSLFEKNMLNYLITDIYCPDILRRYLKKRYTPELTSKKTISIFFISIFRFLLERALFVDRNKVARFCDNLFGFISGAITYFTTNRAIVYSYYIEGFCAFYKLLNKKPDVAICFQVHPTPWFIKKILLEDKFCFDKYKNIDFLQDIESDYDERQNIKYNNALLLFDKIIAASSFTIKSIKYGNDNNINYNIVPYGSKFEKNELCYKAGCSKNNGKIRLITVCQVSQRKGLHWGFYAMSEDRFKEKFEWLIVSNNVDKNISSLAPDNVCFVSGLTNDELAKELAAAEFFVMPSLVEGFGLVYIEAMSLGIPIMYTENTGASDIAVNGVHGIKVNVSSYESIVEAFDYLIINREKVNNMRDACYEKSKEISWENFRFGIRESISDYL